MKYTEEEILFANNNYYVDWLDESIMAWVYSTIHEAWNDEL